MLKPIVKYIENNTSFIINNNLFAGFVPSTITGDYLAVVESGGKPVPDLPDYLEKAVQVLSVATDYQTAMSNAKTIYDLLHAGAGITLPVVVAGEEYYANTIVAISAPQSLGQDGQGRFIISTNYILKIQDK